MMSLKSFRHYIWAGAAAVLCLGAFLFSSCNTVDQGGHTYLKVHVDSSWLAYDSIQILLDHGDGTEPEKIFGGKVVSGSELEHLQVDGYAGTKVLILIRGFKAGDLARAENRNYEGSTQKTLEVVIVRIPDPDPVKSKDGLHLSLGPKDTLITIQDSVPFTAECKNDSGKIVQADWDFDGDGAVDLTGNPDFESGALNAGYRFAKSGVYHPSLVVKGAKGATVKVQITVRVEQDKPTADAGPDTTFPSATNLTLTGKAGDVLGKIVKQEWRIGDGAFAASADGKLTFKTPATAGDVKLVFRVTDDDAQTAEDSAVVHVSAPIDTVRDGLHLVLSPKDTLLSVRDSAAFTANAKNDNGKITKEDWDLDGDGSVDISRNPDTDAALLKAGFRFAKVGTYHPTLTIQGAKGATFQASLTVRVIEDKPVADAGADTTVTANSPVALKGLAKDSLGRIMKQEWRIGAGAFAVTADGKASFTAPGTSGDVQAIYRVTDDDDFTDEDTVFIHVVDPVVATLTQLSLQGCVLAPVFNPATLAYTCQGPVSTTSVAVTAKAQGTMTLNGKALEDGKAGDPVALVSGKATLSLVVTNGAAAKTYTINASAAIASANNALSALTLSAGTLAPVFAGDKLAYTASVASTVASVTLTAALADTTASLTVQALATVSGKPSAPIALATGANAVSIVVTAQSGAKQTYTVNIRRLAGDAALKSLVVTPGTLTPVFAAGTLNYALSVGTATTNLSFTAGLQDTGNASMTLNGAALKSDVATTVSLTQGVTTLTLLVTAEDNAVKRTYVLTVTKVDDAPPTAPAVVLASFFTAPDRPGWSWTPGGGGNGTFRYKMDDSNLVAGSTTTTANGYVSPADMPGGTHTLYVQERDSAGNWSASGKSIVTLAVIKTIADYSLEGHAADTVGTNGDLDLQRVPYLAQGILLSGISGGAVDPTGYSDAGSPILAGFVTSNFSAEVDFKFDALSTTNRPILVGGSSFRWIGGILDSDGKLSLLYNNSSTVKGTLTCTAGEWHTLKLEYVGGIAKAYLDGVLSATVTAALTFSTDHNFQATNPSNATIFKGNWRNLRVYSSGVKIAQYPLCGTLKDITRKQTDFHLTNAPFQAPGPGILCAGAYPSAPGVGNQATTPSLTLLNMDDFDISAEFSISALPAVRMPILVGGPSWRWLAPTIEPAGTLTLMYNNSLYQPTTASVSLAAKHTVRIRFSAASQTAALYLDGVFAGSKSIATLSHNNDKVLTTTNFSNGSEFSGTLYRIKVGSK